MIASGFKPVGWVAGVGAAALGCYMLSLQVAAERASLAGLDQRIIAARQQIRSLQTELGTRGRIQQLEAWNDQVLALSAPVSGQFVEGQVSLARFDARQPPQLADSANVRMASADQAPAPAPAAPATVPRPQRAIAVASAVAPPAPVQQAIVQRTSLVMATPAPVGNPVHNRPAAATPRQPNATPAATPVTRAAPLAAARAPSAPSAERMRLADAGPSQAALRKTPTTTQARPATAPARAANAPTRMASTTMRNSTPALRNTAITPAPRPSALLNDRAMRDLRAASRAERERGTGN